MQLSPVRPPRISPDATPPTTHPNNRHTNPDDTHPTTHPKGSHTNGTTMREMYGREYASDVVSHVFHVLFVGLKINIVTNVVKRDTLDLFAKNIWLIQP